MPLLRESGANYTLDPEHDPPIDFSSDPEIVRTVVEGERLTYGHLYNPAFAAEISLIDPLPHQRLAVYDHMLKQTRLTMLPLFQQEYGDIDEVGELLLRKPEPLAQRLDALREVRGQSVALCNNVQCSLSYVQQNGNLAGLIIAGQGKPVNKESAAISLSIPLEEMSAWGAFYLPKFGPN